MLNKNLIAIMGEMMSGKDTVGKIIVELTGEESLDYKIKKFAYLPKKIASDLLNIPIEDFEKREVKDRVLGEEWDRFVIQGGGKERLTHPHFSSMDDVISYMTKYRLERRSTQISRVSYTVREFIQVLATEGMRDGVHPSIWGNGLFSNFNEDSKWVITDWRFREEKDIIDKNNGVTIRVIRPLQKRYPRQAKEYETIFGRAPIRPDFIKWLNNHALKTYNKLGEAMDHSSETTISSLNAKYTIVNEGTEAMLYHKVRNILENEKVI
jgi:hypothetical protein